MLSIVIIAQSHRTWIFYYWILYYGIGILNIKLYTFLVLLYLTKVNPMIRVVLALLKIIFIWAFAFLYM
jgi:hypothetical protein